MTPWWVIAGSIAGLISSSAMIAYWAIKWRHGLARRFGSVGSIILILPWTLILAYSVHILLRDYLGVIEKNSSIDVVVTYTYTIFMYVITVALLVVLVYYLVREAHRRHT